MWASSVLLAALECAIKAPSCSNCHGCCSVYKPRRDGAATFAELLDAVAGGQLLLVHMLLQL